MFLGGYQDEDDDICDDWEGVVLDYFGQVGGEEQVVYCEYYVEEWDVQLQWLFLQVLDYYVYQQGGDQYGFGYCYVVGSCQ